MQAFTAIGRIPDDDRSRSRTRHLLHGSVLLGRQVVEALVDRVGRLDLVLDADEAGMSIALKARYGCTMGRAKRNSRS